jgi:RNA polymerase sigma-70 factor (ECF subfamily)
LPEPASILSISVEDQIKRCLSNRDKYAIRLIFENYSVAMKNTIMKVVHDSELADDILQDVLVKIWQKGQSFDSSKGSLYTWLIRVSRNAAIDETRSKEFIRDRKSKSIDNFVFNGEAIDQKRSEEKNNDIWETVNLLPESQRCLVDLAYFQGYTQREIAKKLNIPLGTIKTRIRKALETLRRVY